jgi:hypothetical protein
MERSGGAAQAETMAFERTADRPLAVAEPGERPDDLRHARFAATTNVKQETSAPEPTVPKVVDVDDIVTATC